MMSMLFSDGFKHMTQPCPRTMAEVRGEREGRQAAGLLDAAPPSATPQNHSTLFNPVKQCFTHVRRNRPQARVQGVPDTK